ncbi:MAG: acyl-CoA dehydrogenase family protein [Hyphomicrobiaceae bacterium]
MSDQLIASVPHVEASPVARAKALGPIIDAAASEIEATRRIPEPLLTELHRSRLLRLLLPRSCGGDQVAPTDYFKAVEQVARHDASLGWLVFVANSTVLIAPFLEPAIAREIFADPKAVVAWGPPNACRIRAAPGGYRVTGRWDFASGCRQATWMGAHAHVEEADGKLRLNRFGRPTVRTVLFPAAQATLLDTWHTIGLCGTASDAYTVDDVFVSEDYASTREDPTLRREPGPLYAFTMQGLYAIGVAGVAIGTARTMLEEFIALAAKKTPRGLGRIADAPSVQGEVGRAEARLGAASAYITETLTDITARADAWAIIDVRDRGQVRLVSANAIQAAIEVADFVYKAAGVDAIFKGSGFERRFRDIHTLSQQIQARGAHFEAVGQILLGQPPDPFF